MPALPGSTPGAATIFTLEYKVMGRMTKPLENTLDNILNVFGLGDLDFSPRSISSNALCAAADKGDQPAVRRELKNGADPDALHERGWAAVHYAAASGHGGVLQDLARHGADMHLLAKGGYHPKHMLFQCRHVRLFDRYDRMFPPTVEQNERAYFGDSSPQPKAQRAPEQSTAPEPSPDPF